MRQFSPSIAGETGHLAGDLPSLAAALVRAVGHGADVVNISGAVCVPAAQAAAVGAPIVGATPFAAAGQNPNRPDGAARRAVASPSMRR